MAVPAITSITPTGGSAEGGTTVTIVGTALGTPTAVVFGSTAATAFVGESATRAYAIAPAGTGTVLVRLTTSEGQSPVAAAASFTYGAALFTVAEARAYPFRSELPLANTTLYPTATIIATEAAIRELFEKACGVAFVPASVTEVMDGAASNVLRLARHNPLRESPQRALTVTAASIDGTALTETELAAVKAHPNGRLVRTDGQTWSSGTGYQDLAVEVTYTHGYAAVPDMVHDAALRMLAVMLIGSDVPESAVSFSDGGASYQFARPGRAPHWTGVDYVDSRLDMFCENKVAIA